MDIETAKQNIGQPFMWLVDGNHWWDIITDVKDGWVIGNFFDCPVEDARLKQEQPPQLVKKNPG